MHDIVIRGGQLVDGTGCEPWAGDLAIDAGVITALGEVGGRGRQEIDAEGHVVTPGFVDIHTHLDAQIGWDPACTPVSWHGVTTVMMGNCGVTFAPCRPADRELLAGMMETVEDIPKDAILGGLPWNWEGYGGYLDALDGLGLLGFEAAISRDYPVIFGTLFFFTLLGLIVNLISDLTYVIVDPRIDFETREV